LNYRSLDYLIIIMLLFSCEKSSKIQFAPPFSKVNMNNSIAFRGQKYL